MEKERGYKSKQNSMCLSYCVYPTAILGKTGQQKFSSGFLVVNRDREGK